MPLNRSVQLSGTALCFSRKQRGSVWFSYSLLSYVEWKLHIISSALNADYSCHGKSSRAIMPASKHEAQAGRDLTLCWIWLVCNIRAIRRSLLLPLWLAGEKKVNIESGGDSAGKRLILETLLKWLTKELATTVIKTLFSASSVTFSLSEFLTSPIRVSIITWIQRIKILLLKVKETRWDILYPQGRLGNHRCKLELEKMISLSNILKVN